MTNQTDRPDTAGTLMQSGIAAFQRGDFAEAATCFAELADREPENADAFNNLGQAARAVGDSERAKTAFIEAIRLRAEFPEPHLNLGLLAAAAGDYPEAVAHYNAAISLRAEYPEAYFNRGAAFEALGEIDQAIDAYKSAIANDHSYGRAMINLGNLYLGQGDMGAAEEALNAAGELASSRPAALTGLGNLYRARGQLDAALGAYDEAAALEPVLTEPKWNRALIKLARGDFAAGWDDYRFRPSADRKAFPMPEERFPDDVEARWFVFAAEQGLGDELFFLRLVDALKKKGAYVAYRPDPKIADICMSIDGIDRILLPGEEADYSIADLPYFLGTTDTPPSVRLVPVEKTDDIIAKTLPMLGKPPYLGATWRGGMKQPGSLYKDIPLDQFGAALKNWPGSIISLQRNPAAGEAEMLADIVGKPIGDLVALNDNLETMLALLNHLDEYVAVSNTNVHLRAGVGRPTRVLVTNPAEYRWMTDGDRSPWFPDCPLYRQAPDGSWAEALACLARDLAA